jgi:hypothetical protein
MQIRRNNEIQKKGKCEGRQQGRNNLKAKENSSQAGPYSVDEGNMIKVLKKKK